MHAQIDLISPGIWDRLMICIVERVPSFSIRVIFYEQQVNLRRNMRPSGKTDTSLMGYYRFMMWSLISQSTWKTSYEIRWIYPFSMRIYFISKTSFLYWKVVLHNNYSPRCTSIMNFKLASIFLYLWWFFLCCFISDPIAIFPYILIFPSSCMVFSLFNPPQLLGLYIAEPVMTRAYSLLHWIKLGCDMAFELRRKLAVKCIWLI